MDSTIIRNKEIASALLGMKFDIIVDDGNHLLRSQHNSLGNLLPFLKETGVYIVEDALSPHWAFSKESVGWHGPRLHYRVHADSTAETIGIDTGKEYVVFIYGESSLAPRVDVGLVASKVA